MTKVAATIDDEEVRLLLIGDAAEVARGFALIHECWCEPVAASLRLRFPGLNSADLPDLWQETLMQLLLAIRKGTFDAERPLGPFLWTIAEKRAIDRLRAQKRRTSHEVALDAVAAGLRDTSFDQLSTAERSEIRQSIRQFTASLPPRQRMVLQAFADGYPDTAESEVLRCAVSEAAGEEVTLATVKRALQVVREKAREAFDRKGYERRMP